MTQGFVAADLTAHYQRPADGPVWTGDHLAGAQVIGFALIREPEPADQVLLAGEEDAAEPPCRPVDALNYSAAGLRRDGPSPVQGIAEVDLHKAAGYVGGVIERQLAALGPDGEFIRWVLAEAARRRHMIWHVGGTVRDILADGPEAHVNDLDFTGTIGPGELWQLVTRGRRGQGAGDYRQKISARLVWSVTPPGRPRDRVMEYKPLAKTGFRFAAWGGDLVCDSMTRDLTINALYYDARHDVVADPTGRGLSDLRATPRVAAILYNGDDPATQASIILRCVKFRLRWPDLELHAASDWAGSLPGDLITGLSPDQWSTLARLRDHYIPEPDRGNRELAAAAELGDVAKKLIEAIAARAAT